MLAPRPADPHGWPGLPRSRPAQARAERSPTVPRGDELQGRTDLVYTNALSVNACLNDGIGAISECYSTGHTFPLQSWRGETNIVDIEAVDLDNRWR